MKAKLTNARTTPTLEVESEYGSVKIVVTEFWMSEKMLVTVWERSGKIEVDQQVDHWQKKESK
jgi:hypothetical protein